MAEVFNNNLQEFLGNLVKDEQTSFFTRDTLKDLTYKDESEYQDSQAYKDLKHKESNNYFADLLEVVLLKAHQFRKETLLREAILKEEMDFQGEYSLVYTQAEYDVNSLTEVQNINGKQGESFFKNLVSKFLVGSLLTNIIKTLIVTPVKFVFKQALNFSSFLLKTFLRTGVGQYVGKVFTLARQVLVRYTRVAAVSKFFVQSALTVGRYILTNPYALAALGILTLAGGGYLWYRNRREKEGAFYAEIKEEVPKKEAEKYIWKSSSYSTFESSSIFRTTKSEGGINKKPSPEVLDAMRRAAQVTKVPLDWFIKMAWIESRFNPNAYNSTSKAKGLFQFVPGTWAGMLKQYGKKYNIPSNASPYDPYYNSVMAGSLWYDDIISKANKNKNYKHKIDNEVDVYIAHNIGPWPFQKYKEGLATSPNRLAYEVLKEAGFPKTYKNNPYFYFDRGRPLTMEESYLRYISKVNEINASQIIAETSPSPSHVIDKIPDNQRNPNKKIMVATNNEKPIPQMPEPVMYNGILVN